MKRIHQYFIAASLAALVAGCATGSHVITGNVRPAIAPNGVRVFDELPPRAEIIGVVSAVSITGMTWQQAANNALQRLKTEAAKLGANGLVITGSGSDFWSGSSVSGKAVFVP